MQVSAHTDKAGEAARPGVPSHHADSGRLRDCCGCNRIKVTSDEEVPYPVTPNVLEIPGVDEAQEKTLAVPNRAGVHNALGKHFPFKPCMCIS